MTMTMMMTTTTTMKMMMIITPTVDIEEANIRIPRLQNLRRLNLR
jgi:hypothetical protein